MEVPLELMPEPAKSRITSLMKTIGERCSLEKKKQVYGLLEKFYSAFIVEKQVGDGEIEEWVYERLMRGDDWVEETALSLFEEAIVTREESVRSQLCSSIGKDIPEFELSTDEEEEARLRAWESAQSIAETYNERLKELIEECKKEWWEEHGGSYIGLNRWTLLRLTSEKVEEFNEWKTLEIAATEFSTQWQQQALSFWVINRGSATLEYYLAPSTASDPGRDTEPICMEYAGRWLSEDDAQMFPAHPNCIHYVSRTRVKDGQLPIYFMIGGVRYNVEELPDC